MNHNAMVRPRSWGCKRPCITVDMAVVVSQGQNEITELKAKGLDILPHRERMMKEDLEAKFKNPDDPLRLVFVCAMWLTGFDAPSCSTLYLDKPMRNHTLMQTIARANRVFPGKHSGLIVDYANVFASLEKALALYGGRSGGGLSAARAGRHRHHGRLRRLGHGLQLAGVLVDLG